MAKHSTQYPRFRVAWLDANGHFVPTLFEDVPTVSAGSGEIAGIGVGPQGEPGVDNRAAAKRRRRKKSMPMQRLAPPG